MKIGVKISGEANGRVYEILVPAVIDSDGKLMVSFTAANAAAHALRSEMYPESVRDRTPPVRSPRQYVRKK